MTTRRDALTAAGFTVLAGIAAVAITTPDAAPVAVLPASHPDAELVAACTRFLELERRINANYEAHPEADENDDAGDVVNAPLVDAQDQVLRAMHGLRATTAAGHHLRARVLLEYWPIVEREGQPGGGYAEQLTWLLVRDLAAARPEASL